MSKATAKLTPTETCELVFMAADEGKWTVTVNEKSESVSVTRLFPANDVLAFKAADAEWGAVLALVPSVRPGRIFGTEGDTNSAKIALANGYYRMTKSGISKLVLRALIKRGVRPTASPVKGLVTTPKAARRLFKPVVTRTPIVGTNKTTPHREEGTMTSETTAARAAKATKKATRPVKAKNTTKKAPGVALRKPAPKVNGSNPVTEILAVFESKGVNAGRLMACDIARLEGDAKRAAVKAGKASTPMPVNDWMAGDEYRALREGTAEVRNGKVTVTVPATTEKEDDDMSTTSKGTAKASSRTSKRTTANGGEKNKYCPKCGFEFSAPKAQCSSAAACDKRRKSGEHLHNIGKGKGNGNGNGGGAKKAPAKATAKAAKAPAKKATVARTASGKRQSKSGPVTKASQTRKKAAA